MSEWCDAQEVESHLAFLKGRNFDGGSVYPDRIIAARDKVIESLSGKIPKAQFDGWDADTIVIPRPIRRAVSLYAAALVLQNYVDGESISDRQSKAGGLAFQYNDLIDGILKDRTVIVTSISDNTPISTGELRISTSASPAKTFTKGVQADGTEGTLDGW